MDQHNNTVSESLGIIHILLYLFRFSELIGHFLFLADVTSFPKVCDCFRKAPSLRKGSISFAWCHKRRFILLSLSLLKRRTFNATFNAVTSGSYLMQLSGSCLQSMLHINLSQCSQPIVGFSARPLSRASAAGLLAASSRRANKPTNMSRQTNQKSFCSAFGLQFPCSMFIPPLSRDWRGSGPIRLKWCVCVGSALIPR